MTTDRFVLWVAQGFGAGRLPVGPGTWGSLAGFLWLAALLAPRNLAFYGAGLLAGVAVSVWACGRAERLLGHTDPPSVVLDELAALPLCFAGWVFHEWMRTGQTPSLAALFTGHNWLWAGLAFGLFRLFDIWKPWPVRQSQRLPAGWGIAADDLLAAAYTNLVWLPAWWWGG